MKIALAGKGGVGKTTISAALIALFAEKGHRVLAVDADPDANLGAALGVPTEVLDRQPPIIEMKELVESRTGHGSYLILNPEVDDVLDRFRLRLGSVSLFRMGGVKPAGTQCYCKENAFLKALVSSLVLGREDLVVLDFGAGIEHLTRGTASGVDLLLVVTEPTRVSAASAATIARLARSLGVAVRVVGNKVRTLRERDFLTATFGEDLADIIPYDEAVAEAALGGQTTDPSGAYVVPRVPRGELRQSLERLYSEIERLAGGSAG
jgi:CO dehydrogenase maturation factor